MFCHNCRHSEPNVLDDGEPSLLCRRYPPQIFTIDDQVLQAWPQMNESDSCAEWSKVEAVD